MVEAVTASVPVACSPADLTTFTPPPNWTCADYVAEWALASSAQLLNPEASGPSECQVCRWDHGRPVPGAVQPRRRAAGRPLGLLGHLRGLFTLGNLGLV